MKTTTTILPRVALITLLAGGSAAPSTLTAQATAQRELPATDLALALEVTDVTTIGALAGADWEAFGWIRDIGFGPDGSLAILDQQARQVHRVGPDGNYLGPVGAAGDGPGEYQLPTGVTVAPDGTIVVRDTGRSAWVLFAPDGTFLRNAQPDGTLGRPSGIRMAADGSVYGLPNDLLKVQNGRVSREYMVDGSEPVQADQLPLIHLDRDWSNPTVVDRLWHAPRQAAGTTLRDMAMLGSPDWDLLPDGRAVVADTLTWAIRLVGAHLGASDLLLTRPIPPQPITEAMQQAEIERRSTLPNQGHSGGMVSFGTDPEEASRAMQRAREARLREGLGFPEVREVIRGLRVDPQGRIWVARTPDAIDPDAPGPIDVLDASGGYLGTIDDLQMPDAFGPDGLVAWISEGEFEVPVVDVKRVRLGGD